MDAIIGGTNLTSLPNLSDVRLEVVPTPYGEPSAAIKIGRIGGNEVAFLPRHGDPHMLAPHKINYRANIWALRKIGATRVIGIATSGGITGDFAAGVLAVPDQIIDYTHGRETTFTDGTGDDPVFHAEFTMPYTASTRTALIAAAHAAGQPVFDGGCYACFNGPRLETAAEIRRLRNDGCDLVGMTGMPEASLARELELEYAHLCPIVNPAAGIGDSSVEISRDFIRRTRDEAFKRVALVLAEFLS
ncbi:MAG: S-methyl-5'-thioinosine phosphorylase [Rhodobacteraceae bacterium]|nr:S-methyl-5'-thioinosine phosphorylase [Paracoccaceae bacterium]